MILLIGPVMVVLIELKTLLKLPLCNFLTMETIIEPRFAFSTCYQALSYKL